MSSDAVIFLVVFSVIFALRGADGIDLLDNETWSQHGTYWSSQLVYEQGRLMNTSRERRRQRSLHCGGTEKFWTHRHRERVSTTNPAQAIHYAWWLYMLWFGTCRDGSIDRALYLPAPALHVGEDLVNFSGLIRQFAPGLALPEPDSAVCSGVRTIGVGVA